MPRTISQIASTVHVEGLVFTSEAVFVKVRLGSKGRGQLQHSELKEGNPIVSPSENRETGDIKIAKKAKMITVKWGE
jgi:hypothetical protein